MPALAQLWAGLSYIFVIVLRWGLWSAFAAVLVDWLIRSVLLAHWVRLGKWKNVRV